MSQKPTGKIRGARYSIDEVTALVEGYEELRECMYKSWILVRLVDLRRAFEVLDAKAQGAILLCGYHGMSTRVAAPYLGVSHTAVNKRYTAGLEAMANHLNGVK